MPTPPAPVAAPELTIRLLGGYSVQDRIGNLFLGKLQRLQALLAYLLLHRRSPLSRDRIAFALWPDSSESSARTNLRRLFHRLRQELPDVDRLIQIDDQMVAWRQEAPIDLDLEAFERGLAATTAAELRAALDRYAGDLLPDHYADWILAAREQLRQRYPEGLIRLVTLQERQRDRDGAIATARRLLQAAPLGEEGYRRLMRLYAWQGDRGAVERVWQECVQTMEVELELPPSPALAAEHEQLVRLLASERPRHNLPAPPTPFVGREEELAALCRQLGGADCRLLTLVGAGGMRSSRRWSMPFRRTWTLGSLAILCPDFRRIRSAVPPTSTP